MIRQLSHSLVTYQFESLAIEGLVHAVFTRLGGVSRGDLAALNVGSTVGDDRAAVAENYTRVLSHLGLSADQIVTPSMVHGNRVALVGAGNLAQVIPKADGLATGTPGVGLFLRFADCQPTTIPGGIIVGQGRAP